MSVNGFSGLARQKPEGTDRASKRQSKDVTLELLLILFPRTFEGDGINH